MPKLGDFLGDLLAEVTMARVQADLEAVRIAELYANHSLLRHMPVPRFRLPSVRLDVPVLIRGEEESDAAPKPDPEGTAGKFVEIVDSVLEDYERPLLDDERDRIRRAAASKIDEHLELPPDISGSITGIVTDLLKITIRTVRVRLEADEGAEDAQRLLDAIRERLRRQIMVWFIRYVTPPRRLEADMSTSRVKEAGDADLLARIKMEVTEDGVEWATVVGRDGELEDRLVDE